ncbi:MAG: uroporphyrinogen decarboxylase family protein [Planctomycetota bacterium]
MAEHLTGRERIRRIFAGEAADRVGFWMGQPHKNSWPALLAAFGTDDPEAVRAALGDDYRWVCHQGSCYHHPDGLPIFINPRATDDLSAPGVFADCEDPAEVLAHTRPDPACLDFSDWIEDLRRSGDRYRASGMWCPFFHQAADYFGMENYFVKMYTDPEVVHAVTKHLVDFYLAANEKLFTEAAGEIDGFVFGNDFGSQLDMLIGPAQFAEFVAPYFKQLTDQAHAHGRQVILHSCGSIHRIIPDLIAMGVEALHPLQARAANMDAETLARDFPGQVAFVGGIDTQHLLPRGTADEVRAEVRRVRDVLGPRLVVSPSHETLLPDVPVENVKAMAEAARETDD